MTPTESMTFLFERRIIGEEPGTARYDMAIRQAADELEQLARLATDPETAPAVFAWLVEAGVLWRGEEPCDCGPVCRACGHPQSHHDAGECWTASDGTQTQEETFCSCSWADFGSPHTSHYHAAMDHEKALGVGHG